MQVNLHTCIHMYSCMYICIMFTLHASSSFISPSWLSPVFFYSYTLKILDLNLNLNWEVYKCGTLREDCLHLVYYTIFAMANPQVRCQRKPRVRMNRCIYWPFMMPCNTSLDIKHIALGIDNTLSLKKITTP